MRNSLHAFRRVLTVGFLAAAVGCNTESLLEADDPDLVDPDVLNSADGAEGVRLGAMRRWVLVTAGPNSNGNESTWLFGGLLADEWGTASTFVQNDQADMRRIGSDNNTVTNGFRSLHRVRTAVNQALPLMKQWRPTDTTRVAELYLARSMVEMQLASDFCNGIPLSDAATDPSVIIYGNPLTVDSVFKLAVITADSGLAIWTAAIPATDTAALNIQRALRVIKARALLGIGGTANVAAAGALVTVANVPTTFSYNHNYRETTVDNGIWGQPMSNRRYLVGDSLEGNARNILVANNIPFFSSGDNRIRATYTITTSGTPPRTDTTKSQDGLTNSRITAIYARTTSVAVANGIDARLIEAEAQMVAGNFSTPVTGTLAILNSLRSTAQTVGTFTTVPANLPPLVDPGSQAARENLYFREAAFWTFSRGQRLGNLRRMIRQYGRAADGSDTFPSGNHYRGGTYGPDLNLPVPQDEANNPNWKGCLNRSA
jgi:starch-binding outer membrane protein, SusD/RagB family